MIRKLLAATALALVTAAPASAAQFAIELGAPNTGPSGSNYFSPLLSAMGLNAFVTAGAPSRLSLTGPATVEFYYLGAESGFRNTFTAGSGSNTATFTETKDDPNDPGYDDVEEILAPASFASVIPALMAALASPVTSQLALPLPLTSFGSVFYSGPSDLSDWTFTTSGGAAGAPASIGDAGFGIFLPSLAASSGLSDWVLIGYDDMDQNQGDDDNHDDFLLLARVSAVPESATWAMMLAGFVTVGAALRRRPGRRMVQAV